MKDLKTSLQDLQSHFRVILRGTSLKWSLTFLPFFSYCSSPCLSPPLSERCLQLYLKLLPLNFCFGYYTFNFQEVVWLFLLSVTLKKISSDFYYSFIGTAPLISSRILIVVIFKAFFSSMLCLYFHWVSYFLFVLVFVSNITGFPQLPFHI